MTNNMERIVFTASNGDSLAGWSWPIKNPKAHVVIMTGMEETLSRYDAFAMFLNSKGYSVSGLDTFGQGENVNEDFSNIGIWPENGFERFVIADHEMIESIRKDGLPVYIFSHSMGSFHGCDYAHRYPNDVNKIVLCGFAGNNPAIPFAYALSKGFIKGKKRERKSKKLNALMFGGFSGSVKNAKTPFDWLSVNEENVQKYIADPKCGFGPTSGFCLEFLRFLTHLFKKKYQKQISLDQKLFIITGSNDPVTVMSKATKKTYKHYKKLGLKDVSMKVYDGLRHEILNEDRKQEVYDDVVNFFEN